MDLDAQLNELSRVPRHPAPERARSLNAALRSSQIDSRPGARTLRSSELLARQSQELAKGGPPADDDRYALLERLVRAIAQGDPMECDAALAAGAPVNGILGAGPPPIHLAVRAAAATESTACLQVLLKDPRVDVNVASRSGETPLHEAAAAGSTTSVRLLLAAGANPKLRDYAGRTPLDLMRALHVSADLRFPTLSNLLRSAEGARDGRTPRSPEVSHER